MKTTAAETDWDAYERISDDPTDERAGVGRQHDDNEAAVVLRGGVVVRHHTENNTSAYKKRQTTLTDQYGNTYKAWRVMRPVWAEALQRLRSGETKRLMVWDLDRLARDPRDLEDAIEVVEHYGAEIRSATASEIDLSTESGRMNARMLVLMANKSSADTARRVKRQKNARLAQGLPPGSRWRTFGFTRGWQVIPEEAAVVRDVFERVTSGESVNSVTKHVQGLGTLRVSGEPWTLQATVRMLASPIYAGFLTYKGERAGRADVEAIVSETLFDAANGTRVRRPGGRPNTRQTMLSGIAVCAACQTPMIAGSTNGRPTYICNRNGGGCGTVRIKRAWLDDLINDNIWQVLAHDYKRRGGQPKVDTAAQVAALDERIEKTQAALTSGALDYEDGLPMLADLRAKKKALAAAQVVIETFHRVLTDFREADVSRQAAEVRRHVSAILVRPSTNRGSNRFDPSRFDVVLRSGDVVPGPEFVTDGFSRVVRAFADA